MVWLGGPICNTVYIHLADASCNPSGATVGMAARYRDVPEKLYGSEFAIRSHSIKLTKTGLITQNPCRGILSAIGMVTSICWAWSQRLLG